MTGKQRIKHKPRPEGTIETRGRKRISKEEKEERKQLRLLAKKFTEVDDDRDLLINEFYFTTYDEKGNKIRIECF